MKKLTVTSCYYHQMIFETRVTIARYGEKQDLDIIIPTFGVPRKLMQKCKALIDCGSLGQVYSPTSTYSNMQVGLVCF